MRDVALLENRIQEYDWGSHTAIAELLGERTPSVNPQAELWMGAHPRAPSRVTAAGESVSLPDLIAAEPASILGERVDRDHAGRLPFLFKLIAAARPLSIQTHPDAAGAREGFERENALGIPLDAPERNYRDASHKPEIICALTRFRALRGFRPPSEIRQSLDELGASAVDPVFTLQSDVPPARALERFLADLFRLPVARRETVVAELAREAAHRAGEGDTLSWVARLQELYPGDIGVVAPLFLRDITLEPGQAMFLPARAFHCYLTGFGIELMANSDNVLRGGLTSKRVDVGEVMRVLDFESRDFPILVPRVLPNGEEVYDSPAREFRLSRLRVPGGEMVPGFGEPGCELLLCTEGGLRVEPIGAAKGLELVSGRSCLVPAEAGPYRVSGSGTLYRACVPD